VLARVSGRQTEVWSNTETLWTKVIDKHPDVETARTSRGKYYSKKSLQAKSESEKKLYEQKAFNDYRAAISAGTKSPDVFVGTGLIYASNGDPQNAIKFLSAAISIDPLNGSAYYNRAIVYDRLNKKEEAIKDYNIALIYKPDLIIEILNNRSGLLIETSRFREAILDFNYLISVRGDYYLYFSNRAYARQQLGDYSGALSDLKKAQQLNPNDQVIRQQLENLTGLKK
jgi:tetratricopeptide (TPR) repeat protein